MSLILSDAGALAKLNKDFNNISPAGGNDLTLKLFTNDITPSDLNVVGDFVEAAGGGYSAKTLASGSWTVASVAGIATATYEQQTFSFTKNLTNNVPIYGYFVVNADGLLIHSERAPAPYTPPLSGGIYIVVPLYQLSKGTPT